MKRFFDIIVSVVFLILLLPIYFLVVIAITFSSSESIIYYSKRIGKNGKTFMMPKFRTMNSNTPEIASHLINNPMRHYTLMGYFLRKYSLDELPQLFSVIKGDMSIVGPRPALYNQYDLINLRIQKNLYILQPGITGWAQVNGRDDISINKKVEYDYEYLRRRTFLFDLYIIFLTVYKVLKKDSVLH